MNKFKKYTVRFLIVLPLLIVFIITINYIIDPYQQYRKSSYYTFSTKKPRYLNAGLVKNYDYDSLIIGSSMMANFDANKVENLLGFGQTIKPLTFGGFISEEVDTIKTALEHKNIKNILMGLDVYSFSGFNIPSEKNSRFPSYLYDDILTNDFEYLFNFGVLKSSFRSLSHKYDKKKIKNQLNTLYDWQNKYQHFFSGKELINDYKIKMVQKKYLSGFYSFEIMKKNFDNYLFPIIKKNTNINFIFFFPPYSILEYKLMNHQKYLLDVLKFKNYISVELQQYKNIKLYDFQVANEITHNFSNYKDTTHYHKRINNWILDQIDQNKYLKKNNIDDDNQFIDNISLFKVK